jgi:putative aldouronate transport system substrate-binding protein
MKKATKILVCLLVIALLGTIAACTTPGTTTTTTTAPTTTKAPTTTATTTEATTVPYSEQDKLTISYMGSVAFKDGNYLAQKLLEDYNIELNLFGTYTAANTEVPLLLASGQYPEWIYSDSYGVYHTPAYDGYFINYFDYLDQLPDYKALFTDEQWEKDVMSRCYDDGGLYFLPQYRAWVASMGWLVREDLVLANGLEIPKTDKDILALCETWKEIYPDSLPIADKWQTCFTGCRYIYGAYPFINSKTGEYQAHYQSEKEYREALILFHELYTKGYVEPEFATVSNAQFEERFATSTPVLVYGAVAWEDSLNNFTKAGTAEVNKNPNWRAIEAVLYSAANDKKYYELNVSAQNWGSFLTDKVLETGGLLERMLDFFNWTCTEEGLVWQTFGVEGESFNYVSGTPVYNTDKIDPMGSLKSGLPTKNDLGLTSITAWSPDAITAMYNSDAWKRFGDAAKNDPKAVGVRTTLALKVPEDKVSRKAELETMLGTVRAEYVLKFQTGLLNPNSDEDWTAYIKALNDAGLEEYEAMMEALYKDQYK